MKTRLFLLFICLIPSATSNAQNWQWAKRAGSVSVENISSVCTDNIGNVYVLGQFSTNNPWAPYMLFDTDTVYNIGVNQIFIAKYSSSGSILWTRSLGGSNPNQGGSNCANCEYSYGLEIDTFTSSIIITGQLWGGATFGNVTLNGMGTLFVTKIDFSGTFLWSKTYGNIGVSASASVSCNLTGDIYLSGYTNNLLYIDSVSITAGFFWAKLDQDGNAVWAKNIGKNTGSGKLFFANNSIYSLFGTTNDTVWIDSSIYISTSTKNMLFAKFDNFGNILWYKPVKAKNYLFATLDVDSSGNFFIAGTFKDSLNFGTISLTNPNYDMFIAKYNSLGNLIWVKQSGSTNDVTSGAISTALDGSTYIGGSFSGALTLDSFSINSSSPNEIFVTRYDSLGHCMGITQVPNAVGVKISVGPNGSFYLGSEFYYNITIANSSFITFGAGDIFIAKHDAITGIPDPRRSTNNQLFIHANPNEGKCNITVPDEFLHEKNLVLSIYNSSGKLIQQKKLEMNEGKIKLSLEAEAKGLYNAVLSNGTKSYSGKIVFE
ncbi:MAG: T9SS type A sorting domain-containing protein [Bacteroidetes bacterium]|nr:T9SS type A sorting domain-containing protein [Bacteroidota bacterium]